ncbi:spore coat protein GerQ [Aquibacillus salsiterrae]|uniref:Spore coat protein GerQ n=1 Tax=Aquibacillus salsiterrae TaxID=2950439 RepID=A0A9X4AG76_9BACI|nr:spore coat protein GerQ [Aquibacillus salsiterrae]MDC3416813.1 spore coat protein GerQ [Aquibacillus salsiterrae]
MSNEENRNQPQQGYYPGYTPGAQGVPGAEPVAGAGYNPVPGVDQVGGAGYYPGYGYNPYYQQVPYGYQAGGQFPQVPNAPQAPVSEVPGMLPTEESYIENILRLNKGKVATVYMTFENNDRWNAKIFKGVLEAAGRDHIILSDPETGRRYLLLMVYLDYVTFDEELNYEYPYGAPGLAAYPPR